MLMFGHSFVGLCILRFPAFWGEALDGTEGCAGICMS